MEHEQIADIGQSIAKNCVAWVALLFPDFKLFPLHRD
jgi:hypothetical protein